MDILISLLIIIPMIIFYRPLWGFVKSCKENDSDII